VNGQPGAILRDRDGKVLITLALDVLHGRIQTLRTVINPDKPPGFAPPRHRDLAEATSIPGTVPGIAFCHFSTLSLAHRPQLWLGAGKGYLPRSRLCAVQSMASSSRGAAQNG